VKIVLNSFEVLQLVLCLCHVCIHANCSKDFVCTTIIFLHTYFI